MNNPYILIVEDDPDQMDLLVDFARSEIRKISDDENSNDEQREKAKSIKVIKVSNISTLQKVVAAYKYPVLAVLDCNIPDTKDDAAHDQLVKTNHAITGQHRSVDIVTKHLPGAPITMISSLNRFQRIVSRYYESKHNLDINFISKKDHLKIKENIEHHLAKYLGLGDN